MTFLHILALICGAIVAFYLFVGLVVLAMCFIRGIQIAAHYLHASYTLARRTLAARRHA